MWHCYWELGMELIECNVALLLMVGNGTDGMKCGTVIGSGECNPSNVKWHSFGGGERN